VAEYFERSVPSSTSVTDRSVAHEPVEVRRWSRTVRPSCAGEMRPEKATFAPLDTEPSLTDRLRRGTTCTSAIALVTSGVVFATTR
jgi:hypothetical protein